MDMRKKGMLSSADEYQDLYDTATDNIRWYDVKNEERMFHSSDKADAFNMDVYIGFMGDDPEWKVGGTIKRYDPSATMQRMKTPTLICVGRFDRVAMPSIAGEIHRLIADSSLVIFEKSSHSPWVEETDL